ncbi:hypothetical protein AB2M62_16885 [Sphingomonas sp. MMS12-HWE2-04]|uniref:hypothetical protein n=1 Tax=Sphingomonas sp. MMS12-HWE2-04 TaxID=3234199 RepID=UPI00384FC705
MAVKADNPGLRERTDVAQRRRRSRVRYLVRALTGGLLVMAAVQVTRHSVATTLIKANPAQAVGIAPWHAAAREALASETFGAGSSPSRNLFAEREARLALGLDLTRSRALRVVAQQADLTGRADLARTLFRLSENLSRRDLITELWLIEDAVRRNNTGEALEHYDYALRTTTAAELILFPILGAGIPDVEIRRELLQLLKQDSPWREAFLSYSVGISDPRPTAMMFQELAQAKIAIPTPLLAALVNRLIGAAEFEGAWSAYSLLHPKERREQVRQNRFEAQSITTRLDWVVEDEFADAATLGEGLVLAVPSGAKGRAVRQLQLLPTGRFRLAGRVHDVVGAAGASLLWRLSCADGREIGKVTAWRHGETAADFAGSVVVPSGCNAQWLDLIVDSGAEETDLTGAVEFISLRRE